MKRVKNYFYYFDIFVSSLFFCSLFFLFFYLSIEKETVWTSYRILFLPINANEETILQAAKKNGINGIISSNSIYGRFKELEENNCIDSPFTTKENYSKWFINRKENIRYMYIPITENIPPNFFKFLKDNTDAFYIERNSCFSLFQFTSAIAFFLIAFYCSSRKEFYFFSGLPFVFYAGVQAGILALSASILMLFSLAFWTEAIGSYLRFTKRQLIERIQKNPLLLVFPVISFVIAKFNSNISLILFIIFFVMAASFTYISERFIFFLHKNNESKRVHKQMITYAMSPVSVKKFWKSKRLFIVAGSAIFIIVFSNIVLYLGSRKTMQAYKNILYLPAPYHIYKDTGFSKSNFDEFEKKHYVDGLPDLSNFILDSWYMRIKPYVRLGENFSDQHSINYSNFLADENGVVTEIKSEALSLDDDFILATLSLRQKSSIEDLLYKQGSFVTVSYIGKKFPLNNFTMAALVVALLSSCMPAIIIILRVLDK